MNYFRIIVIFSTLPWLFSCIAGLNYQADDSPVPMKTISPMTPKPRIALVLGSGGPRGYAHIGILKVLEQNNIDIDLVVGSSVGALIGAFWAAGYSADEISKMSYDGGPLTLFDVNPFLKKGWIKGQKLQDYVNSNLNNVSIEALAKALIVVATEEHTGEPTFFAQGNVGVAVRASSAVLNIFSPVGINNVTYIDADESLPVAVLAARQAGAEFVIAVDVSARPGAAPIGTSEKQLAKDSLRRSRIDPQIAMADFLIHPDLDYKAGPWRSYFVAAEIEGERYAKEIMTDLLAEILIHSRQ